LVPRNGECVSCPPIPLSPKGEWDVENHGVDPDYAVEQDPKAVSEGHDPQLEKAVALALEELEKHPVKKVERPALLADVICHASLDASVRGFVAGKVGA